MKIFIVRGGCCAKDVTEEVRASLAERSEGIGIRLAEGESLALAPDEVFEGWGIGSDGSFLAPRPPSGWAYDGLTGTFYRIGDGAAETEKEKERNKQAERKG